ncbi:hypothetical protein AgCh_003278 [Apium graveolens]
MDLLPIHLLFEFVSGYALFVAHDIYDVDMKKFEAVEEYLNRTDQIFELKSFLPFSSDDEALDQMNVISNSTITDKLKEFLKDYFPTPTHCDTVGTCDAVMGGIMSRIVPHRFEGLFSVKGKENILCTRNLVPGEALYGEKNEEDRTEIEYRVWDRLRSKLAPAIHFGVTNIWIKPGSHVLYMGNVCGLAVSDLSDLVGLDGLVYVVGFSDDDVADMAGRRPNVLTINMKEGSLVLNNSHFYLRAGGHYMISRKANNMNSTGRFIFAARDNRREFKPIETLMLGAYALDVGAYRM